METLLNKMIAITKVSLVAILLLAFLACSKYNPPECEKWEVVDEGHNIGGCIDFGCVGRTYQLFFCGDALENAKAGNTITLSEDQYCKKTRTFVRFIE